MRKLSVFGVLLLMLATMSLAMAQTPRTITIAMQAVSPAKVTGKAVLTEAGTGVKVSVSLTGFDPNTKHDGHIHVGTCEKQGGVIAPLGTITADASGAGSVDSTVTTFSFAAVSDGNHYIQYHTSSNPPGVPVSCANIPAATAGQGGAPAVPATGIGGSTQSDGFPVALLAGLLLGLVGAGAGYRVVRQRSK